MIESVHVYITGLRFRCKMADTTVNALHDEENLHKFTPVNEQGWLTQMFQNDLG